MLCMLLALCGAGCSTGGDAPPPVGPLATPTPSPAPQSGGTLRMAVPVNSDYSDPLLVDTEELLNLFSLVYDPLIAVDESGSLQPALAESWISEGDGVWLVRLRQGVFWHGDIAEFTSQDVYDTVQALKSYGSSCYYGWCAERILSCDIVDTYTVRFSMSDPGVMALTSLSFPIRRNDLGMLVGTGGYRLLGSTDESISLIANDDWWDRTPYIRAIEVYERASNETMLASYEAGQLNFVPTDLLTAGKYSHTGVTNVLDVMTQNMEVLLCNHEHEIMQSRELRLAIAHGINRSRLVTNVYMNRARTTDVPFPSDSRLYDSRQAVLNYDPAVSASLLQGLGYRSIGSDGILHDGDGRELRLTLLTSATTENTTRSNAANLIASQLLELGIVVDVVTAEHTIGDEDSAFIQALDVGEWDIALVGFNLGIDNDLSEYLLPEGSCNFGHYSSAQMETLVYKMRLAERESTLVQAASELQALFVQEVPFITLYFRLNSIVYSYDIKGLSAVREPCLMRNIKDWWMT